MSRHPNQKLNYGRPLAPKNPKPLTSAAQKPLARSRGVPVEEMPRPQSKPSVPFTVVLDCPYCDGAHVLEKMESMNVFACAKADSKWLFDPSALKLVEVT